MISLRLKPEKKPVSFFPYLSIWIALALIARLTLFIRRRPDSDFIQIDGFAAAQIALVGLACGLLILFPYRSVIWQRISRTSGSMILLYYVLSGVSALWPPLPEYSLFRAVEYLSQASLVFIAIWYCSDFVHAERRVLLISFLVILLGASAIVILRGFHFNLLLWHTNSYSASAAIVFCYCFAEFIDASQERKKYLIYYCIGSFAFLILGTSVASFIAAGCGIVVAILFSKQGQALLVHLLVAIPLIGFLMLMIVNAQSIPSWTQVGQQLKIISTDSTGQVSLHLHGRVLLWEHYLELIQQSPIYGHGIAVSSRLSRWATTNTHNGLLAVILGTGAIGLMVFLAGLYRLLTEVRFSLRFDRLGATGCVSAFVAALVNNMSISFIGEQWRSPSLVFFAFLGLHLFFILSASDVSQIAPQVRQRVLARQGRASRPRLVPLSQARHAIPRPTIRR